jgi:hypothetical protein
MQSGVYYPVTVAGQPRIYTGVPCYRQEPYQSATGAIVARNALGSLHPMFRQSRLLLLLGGTSEAAALARSAAGGPTP